MRRTKSLWSQSPAFWIGSGLLAEVPLVLVLMSVDPSRRTEVLDYILGRPLLIVVAIAVALVLPVLVAWCVHRVGLAD